MKFKLTLISLLMLFGTESFAADLQKVIQFGGPGVGHGGPGGGHGGPGHGGPGGGGHGGPGHGGPGGGHGGPGPRPYPYPAPRPYPYPAPRPYPYPAPRPLPPYGGVTYIRCESINYQYTQCYLGWNHGVQLVQQLSNSPCQYGYSWGTLGEAMWVDRGCRATFAVQR